MRLIRHKMLREATTESPALPSEFHYRLYLYYILHCHSRPHHIVVERRVLPFLKQDGLNENIHFVNINPEVGRKGQPVAFNVWYDDGHVNVALWFGIAFGIGAIHIDFRLGGKPWGDYSLVVSDEAEGFIAGKNLSFIHCCICFVSSIMFRLVCSLRERAMPLL